MKTLLSVIKKILLMEIVKNKKIKTNDNVDVIKFKYPEHLVDFYKLYPEYSKGTDINKTPFGEYVYYMIKNINAQNTVAFTIIERKNAKIIGFIIGDKLYPFIINAHIVVNKEYRNFYNAYNAAKKAIEKVFDTDIRQILAFVDKDNKNVQVLLKKIGFDYWGEEGNCMAYTLIKASRKE